MRISPLAAILIALFATVSSTVIALSYRDEPGAPADDREQAAAPAGPRSERSARAAEPVSASKPAPAELASVSIPVELLERLDAIERRLSALEERGPQRRTRKPVDGAPLPEVSDDAEALRLMVLDWVAQDREARNEEREREDRVYRDRELDFEARHQAMLLAQERGLEPWQEEQFAELFREMHQRAEEIEDSIDLANDNPLAVEERWGEFDAWIDARERELTLRIAPELYEEVYGEDGDGDLFGEDDEFDEDEGADEDW